MRHVYANRAALVLALFLVASAALFGWWRSQGLALVVLVDEERIAEVRDDGDAGDAEEDDDAEAQEEAEPESAAAAEADEAQDAAEADEAAEPRDETDADDAAEATTETGGAAEPADWAWQDLGENTYDRECSSCHGRLPHVPSLAAADGGRGYLVDLLLYGFEGEATIDGAEQSLDHLAFGELDDEEIAAVLDHMLATFGDEGPPEGVDLYRPGEIEAARGRDLSPEEVASSRPTD